MTCIRDLLSVKRDLRRRNREADLCVGGGGSFCFVGVSVPLYCSRGGDGDCAGQRVAGVFPPTDLAAMGGRGFRV